MAVINEVMRPEDPAGDWMKQAACKGLSNLFFPRPAERPQARERREATARAVCRRVHRQHAVPGVRPPPSRVRVLGRGERGRAPRRRLPPDRADRSPRPCRLTAPATLTVLQVNTGPAPFDVCVVGSSNLDLVVTAPRHPDPARRCSAPPTTSIPAARVSTRSSPPARAGARAAFVSALGDDAAGQRLAGVLADEDIDATAVQWLASTATGRALITVDAAGENSIVVIPGANADLHPAPLPDARRRPRAAGDPDRRRRRCLRPGPGRSAG